MVARNGFLTKFYIVMITRFFFQLIFFDKIFQFENKKIFFGNFSKFSDFLFFFQRKNLIFLYDFRKFSKFSRKNIFSFKVIFFVEKNELRKKSNYHFDVEFSQEYIFGIDKCNRTLWVGLLRAQKKAPFL